MKAEHRKELQTNTLSAALAKWLESLRGGPTNASVVFWVFLILAVGLVVGWRYYYASAQQAQSALWTAFEQAGSPEAFEEVSTKKDALGTPIARYARLERARLLLKNGMEKLLASTEKEREDAVSDIGKAADEYEKLAVEMSASPVLAQEALYGLAKARESQGNIDGAIEAYEKLTSKYKDAALAKVAAPQLERLKNNRTDADEFYAKLREFAPPPKKSTPE